MDSRPLIGLISLGVFVVLAVILAVRARSLRDKEYSSWLDSYRATTAQPETDPSRLREQWMSDLRAQDQARREVAHAQNHPEVVASAESDGVRPSPPMTEPRTNTFAVLSLVFGLGGGLLGIVFGHVALSQIRAKGEGGRGAAIAGLVLGYGWIAFYVLLGTVAYIISSTR